MSLIQVGRYQLTRKLATGGMGEVFEAVQLGLGDYQKPLAIKLLLPHLTTDQQCVQMFLDEAQIAARMSHRNVVQIFDVGLADERYYLAMELVRGLSLSTLIRRLKERDRKLPAELLAYIAHELCAGLHHAHEQRGADGHPLGVVHRDVSPQNVIVSNEGEVKLADFGIAKVSAALARTRPSTIKGKLEYVAPEQVSGLGLDRRADIFAAGVTLYHLATLQSPFRRDEDAATLNAVLNCDVPPLEQLRPDLKGALSDAVSRAMCKRREDRFSTTLEFRNFLPPASSCAKMLGELIFEFEPISAASSHPALSRPQARRTQGITSPVERKQDSTVLARGGVRRHPMWWALPAGVAAAVCVGLAAPKLVSAQHKVTPPAGASQGNPPIASVVDLHAPEPSALQPAMNAPAALEAVQGAGPPSLGPGSSRHRSSRWMAAHSAHEPAGFLTIDATPWGSIYVEGRHIGDTPLARIPFRPGEVKVVLKNPETGRTTSRRVKVSSNRESILNVNLQ